MYFQEQHLSEFSTDMESKTPAENYLDMNKVSWNKRTDVHVDSEFYGNKSFINGRSSLNDIELPLLGDLKGKRVLHLQCHFGQDTISMARMGAKATGVDLSDKSVVKAKELTQLTDTDCEFVCCNVYDLPEHLDGQFDIVFTSYGTITWLPDLNQWAGVISHFLKPGGQFIFVEFHPYMWMYDDDMTELKYRYFNSGRIVEDEVGTYADKGSSITQDYVTWNHSMGEVVNSLLGKNIAIDSLNEYDYSPYDIFGGGVEFEPGKFRVAAFDDKLPMVYSIVATKKA